MKSPTIINGTEKKLKQLREKLRYLKAYSQTLSTISQSATMPSFMGDNIWSTKMSTNAETANVSLEFLTLVHDQKN